jgi:hypothetical protein
MHGICCFSGPGGGGGEGDKGRGSEAHDADVCDDVSKALLIVLVKVCNAEKLIKLLQADSVFCCESNKAAVSAVYSGLNLVQKFGIGSGENEGRETGRKADKEREAKREKGKVRERMKCRRC